MWAASWFILVELPVIGVVVQLFPTGRPLPRWRPYLLASVLAGLAGIAVSAIGSWPHDGVFDADTASGGPAVPLLAFAAIGGIVPLVARARRTIGPERRAVVWLIVIVAASALVPAAVSTGGEGGEVLAQCFTVGQLVFATGRGLASPRVGAGADAAPITAPRRRGHRQRATTDPRRVARRSRRRPHVDPPEGRHGEP